MSVVWTDLRGAELDRLCRQERRRGHHRCPIYGYPPESPKAQRMARVAARMRERYGGESRRLSRTAPSKPMIAPMDGDLQPLLRPAGS